MPHLRVVGKLGDNHPAIGVAHQHAGFVDRVESPTHIACIGAEVAERRWIGANARQLIHYVYAVPSLFQSLRHVVPNPPHTKPAVD